MKTGVEIIAETRHKNFKIDGVWIAPPENVNMRDWLNEPVAIAGLNAYFEPRRYIRRFERIERIRKNGRGKGRTLINLARVQLTKQSDEGDDKRKNSNNKSGQRHP